MGWFDRARFRLRMFGGRPKAHEDIDDEIHFHIDMLARQFEAQGLSSDEARRRALIEFGGTERYTEQVRDIDGVGWIERLLTDLRFGLRLLRRSPIFTAVAVVTLGLGIGASTAIFSVVDGILLRSLPYPEPDRLVSIWADYTRRGGPVREWLSFPNFHDARSLEAVFDEAGTYTGWGPALTGEGDAQIIQGSLVSEGFLSRVLRVQPEVGRALAPEDDIPGAPAVVLLSHGLWTRLFGQDPGVVGRAILLNDQPYTVIGVMPAGFRQPFNEQAEMWGALQWNETDFGGSRGSAILRAVGRLRPDVTLETARQEAQVLATRLEEEYPEVNTGVGYSILPLRDDLVSSAAGALWVLLGAVGFVLLIVSVNLANLQLARGSARTGELAARAAVGASRHRLLRQLLTESILLATIGGVVGTLVAVWATSVVLAMAPAGIPRLSEVAVDARVLLFTLGATVLTGVAFGLGPAVQSVGVDLKTALGHGGRNAASGRRSGRVRRWLVVAQMGIALVLLVGAGLFVRSFRALGSVDLGYDPEGVVTFAINMPQSRYDRPALIQFVGEVEDRIRALPGVLSVGSVGSLPLSGADGDSDFQLEGRPEPPLGEERVAWMRRTTPGYFEAMRIAVVEGRTFQERDAEDGAPVLIVNQSLARRYYGEESPIGRRININSREEPVWREIVGVARDVKNFGIRADARVAIYFPHEQIPTRNLFVVARTQGDPSAVVPLVRSEVAALDPSMALTVQSMDELVRTALSPDRFVATLLSGFALVALVLAAVGLLGVVSYGVSQRIREMGVRVALGARSGEIAGLVVKDSMVLAGIGVAVGVVGALVVTRWTSSLLYGVQAADPVTFVTVSALLLAVAAAGAAIPAWRASRVDPVRVLRVE